MPICGVSVLLIVFNVFSIPASCFVLSIFVEFRENIGKTFSRCCVSQLVSHVCDENSLLVDLLLSLIHCLILWMSHLGPVFCSPYFFSWSLPSIVSCLRVAVCSCTLLKCFGLFICDCYRRRRTLLLKFFCHFFRCCFFPRNLLLLKDF